jgi:hypothetical protein
MSDFVKRNKPVWTELEELVKRARKRIRRLTPEELARLDSLYRRTAVHLAQVTTRTRDVRLTKYLNDLTAAAHSIIYLPPRRSAFKGALLFVTEGFGRAVARTWRYHVAAAVLCFGGAVFAYYAASNDVLAAYALSPPAEMAGARMPGSSREQLQGVLQTGPDQGSNVKLLFASY